MRDSGYEACGTERVDMRKRITAQMVKRVPNTRRPFR